MEDAKFTVGMRVRDRYDRRCLGTIVYIYPDDDGMDVQWDNEENGMSRVEEHEVFPLDEALDEENKREIQSKIDMTANSFELAFQTWKETKELLYDKGFDLDDLNTSKLEDVFDQIGWSTSSLHC